MVNNYESIFRRGLKFILWGISLKKRLLFVKLR